MLTFLGACASDKVGHLTLVSESCRGPFSVCFACWMWFWFVGARSRLKQTHEIFQSQMAGSYKKKGSKHVPGTCGVSQRCIIRFLQAGLVFGLIRIGEALNPGPQSVASKQTWTLGICNPSGLNSKVDQCAFLDGDVWLISESQLTTHGLHRFKTGMRQLGSEFSYFVPGFPSPHRGNRCRKVHWRFGNVTHSS